MSTTISPARIEGISTSVSSSTTPAGSGGPAGTSFKEALQHTNPSNPIDRIFGGAVHHDIQKLQAELVKGTTIPARDLLLYQMKLGFFNQRVELVSKLAESGMATMRKFQNQQ